MSDKGRFNTKYIVLIIVAGFLILGIMSFILILPSINLSGGKVINIEVFSEYIEKGFTSKYLGEDISDEVIVEGSVNTNELGTYKITYSVTKLGIKISEKRIVKVIDSTKPVITLEGDQDKKVCSMEEYTEDGFSASDNYDKDITDNVVLTKDTINNRIIYTVVDSNNNKEQVYRTLKVGDTDSPVITLKGGSTIYLVQGSKYIENGFVVEDDCDKDLEDKVEVTGSVNSNVVGTYVLTYTVVDKAMHSTSVKRTVKVIAKATGYNDDIGKKGVIYLTFDDGPSNSYTGYILDVLKNEDVKATFFVTMSGADSLILREYQEGHTVALHTASHNYAEVYSSVDNYFKDLEKVQNRVKRITGQTSMIVRFPGGSSNTVSRRYSSGIMTVLTSEVLNRGYRYYDWNISSGDAGECSSSECIYNNVVSRLSKNKANIVLMHDIKYYTALAISDIIKYGKENGYTFEAITMDTPMVRHKVNN